MAPCGRQGAAGRRGVAEMKRSRRLCRWEWGRESWKARAADAVARIRAGNNSQSHREQWVIYGGACSRHTQGGRSQSVADKVTATPFPHKQPRRPPHASVCRPVTAHANYDLVQKQAP